MSREELAEMAGNQERVANSGRDESLDAETGRRSQGRSKSGRLNCSTR